MVNPMMSFNNMPEWMTYLYMVMNFAFLAFLFIMFFVPSVALKFQLAFYIKELRGKVLRIAKLAQEASMKAEKALSEAGVRNAKDVVSRTNEFYYISPVDIEPIDIIRRLEHILDVFRHKYMDLLDELLPDAPQHIKRNLETILALSSQLNLIHKIARHYLLLGEKTKNFTIISWLYAIIPMLMRLAESSYKMIEAVDQGKPIGDGAGPLVAYRLLSMGPCKIRKVCEDTVVGEVEIDGRKVIVVKAEGPGSAVGKPGEAIMKVVDGLQGKIARIITVDAALKLEGESTGLVAEEAGAAIGDPGPEKIKIERAAVKYKIPLEAIIIKMSIEEAGQAMKKEIAEAVDKVVEKILNIIRNQTKPGETILVAGIGNTCGIAQ